MDKMLLSILKRRKKNICYKTKKSYLAFREKVSLLEVNDKHKFEVNIFNNDKKYHRLIGFAQKPNSSYHGYDTTLMFSLKSLMPKCGVMIDKDQTR